jgi:hypothetical protein
MSEIPAKRPSEIARDALRAFIRNHPRWDRRDPTTDPSRMTKDQLRALVSSFGGDPNGITARAIFAADHANRTQTAAGRTDGAQPQTPETKPTMPLDNTAAGPTLGDIDTQLETIKDKLVEGGFGAVRTELRQIIQAAQRPPVVIEKIVERVVHAPAPERLPAGVHNLQPKAASTWGALFGLKCPVSAAKPITVWDHPDAPKHNAAYVFPEAETALALSQMSRSEAARAKGAPAKHVLLVGPAGTGKSTWAREFAALTGRPFVTIPLSDGVEIDQLMGQTVLDGKGSVKWQDGLLLSAMRQPGMVICLDEVGGMRPAVGVALNGLLQDMVYYVPDTGERVAVARGVCFVATNNANLMDGGASKGYVGIGRQNRAFADRFGVTIEVGYAPAATERKLLQTYTGCTPELARILVDVAGLSRAKASSDDITHGIGFRRLIAWAECLMDGVAPELAFKSCVLNTAPEADGEILRQLALVTLDASAIRSAIHGAKPAARKAGPDNQFTDLTANGEG